MVKKFRRLTKVEANRLGVSHSAKRRVDASLKRVTKSTKLYSDRQVAELKLGKRREVAAKENFEERRTKKGGTVREYHNLTKQNLFRLLEKNKKRVVLVQFHAKKGSHHAEYKGRDITDVAEDKEQWYSGASAVDAHDLLEKGAFEDYMEASDLEGDFKYNLVVYL